MKYQQLDSICQLMKKQYQFNCLSLAIFIYFTIKYIILYKNILLYFYNKNMDYKQFLATTGVSVVVSSLIIMLNNYVLYKHACPKRNPHQIIA